MKKKTTVIALTCIILLGAVITAARAAGGRQPYQNLDAAEIVSAKVRLTPPDKTLEIGDIPELVKYLSDVVIYEKDNSYSEYAGQGVTFTLTLANGKQTEITAYNPFLVIDGVGYQTEYVPCEALNRYANGLLHSENAAIILEEPPALTVTSGETSIGALLGTYSWQKKDGDGTSAGAVSDSAHPLDCKKFLSELETAGPTATLNFAEKPNALNVRCWSEAHWSDPDADAESAAIDGYEITLKPGGYIYEVKAEWDTGNGYGGTAYYSFFVRTSDPQMK